MVAEEEGGGFAGGFVDAVGDGGVLVFVGGAGGEGDEAGDRRGSGLGGDGVGAHATNALEFIHEAGMTPMDCIKSVNAADLCGIADQVGTIENGKTADIIAVPGDPLEDVGVLGEVGFVMARGKVFEGE